MCVYNYVDYRPKRRILAKLTKDYYNINNCAKVFYSIKFIVPLRYCSISSSPDIPNVA